MPRLQSDPTSVSIFKMKDAALYREPPDSFNERLPAPPPALPPKRYQWDLSIAAFVFLLLIAAVVVVLVPKFSVVYSQVKIPVPYMTQMLLGLSQVACRHLWLVGIILILVPWGLGRLKGRIASIASLVLPVVGIVTLAWMVVMLFLPTIGELEGIGSKQR